MKYLGLWSPGLRNFFEKLVKPSGLPSFINVRSLDVLFFGAIFLKVLVSEFALIFGLLWQCAFNTAYTLLFNENLFVSYNFK